jgi:hypothetical protein
MVFSVNPKPLGPFLMMMGGLRDLARGDTSLDGEPSRELVLDPPGDNIGFAINSSVIEINFPKSD